MKIKCMSHVAVSTSDLGRQKAFYESLGFEEVFNFRWLAGDRKADAISQLEGTSGEVVWLKLGGMCVELVGYRTPQGEKPQLARRVCDHGISHICLQVEDLAAVYAELAARGVPFHCPPQDFGGVRATYGRDPDGNVIEFIELPAGSPLDMSC